MRVLINGATGFIGFVNDKFDNAKWLSVSNNGTEILYLTNGIDQIGVDGAGQILATRQPIIPSDGKITWDGVDDLLTAPIETGGANYSYTFVFNSTYKSTVANKDNAFFSGGDSLTPTERSISCFNSGGNRFTFLSVVGSSFFQPYFTDGDQYMDGIDHIVTQTFDSAVGVRVWVDTVEKTIVSNHFNPANLANGLGVGGNEFIPSSLSRYNGKLDALTYRAATYTPQQVLDLQNQWITNEAS